MTIRLATVALTCAAVVAMTTMADAQSSRRYYRDWNNGWYGPGYGQGYRYDYDRLESRRDPIPANRSGAGNFGNLSPPLGGVGRVDSHTQN